ncbi:serine hydrolase domain-containing protein [Streptomyces sp. P9(2023)]|uniref:serine hydrolase domain-containing protein n=1 Tax=Streptomyces sp. P9(2023) TaxID=3064394 RepID=UPI0028F415D2|nr:serine hydrolase domain-containing protein [Streptomyces sp. P9(2023)]MDT9693031.1 serine hydrolase domain-containing protein [Streptomyces sp. P9(2023)]
MSPTAIGEAPVPAPHTDDGEFPELTPAVAARIDKVVQHTMRETQVPGVIVGLSAPGKGSYVKAFGVADKQTGAAMTPDLYMRIGSVTKTFTVTALLRLDDTIDRYVSGVPNGERITLRQLAGMRSGLYNYADDPDFNKQLDTLPTKPFTQQELLDYSFKHGVQFAPGTQFEYANTNLILIGQAIEKATGRPLQDVMEDQVLEPAGLSRTTFPTTPEFPEPHAHGYTEQTTSGEIEDATDLNPSWGWAAGAIISDLQDLRSWARTLATGTLLTPETQAERLDTQPIGIPNASYGLGIFDVNGWIGHDGSTLGYESLVVYLPEAEATLVILLNTDVLTEGKEPSAFLGQADAGRAGAVTRIPPSARPIRPTAKGCRRTRSGQRSGRTSPPSPACICRSVREPH